MAENNRITLTLTLTLTLSHRQTTKGQRTKDNEQRIRSRHSMTTDSEQVHNGQKTNDMEGTTKTQDNNTCAKGRQNRQMNDNNDGRKQKGADKGRWTIALTLSRDKGKEHRQKDIELGFRVQGSGSGSG